MENHVRNKNQRERVTPVPLRHTKFGGGEISIAAAAWCKYDLCSLLPRIWLATQNVKGYEPSVQV
jgi:hypothetical protein